MGVVYKAVQTALGRTVALKMILEGQATGDARVRFFTEAEAMARLRNPAWATLIGVSTLALALLAAVGVWFTKTLQTELSGWRRRSSRAGTERNSRTRRSMFIETAQRWSRNNCCRPTTRRYTGNGIGIALRTPLVLGVKRTSTKVAATFPWSPSPCGSSVRANKVTGGGVILSHPDAAKRFP